MKKQVLQTGILSMLIISMIGMGCTNTHEKDDDKVYDEPDKTEFHQTGADKQMMTWLWSKGYPDPTNLSSKFWKGWLEYNEIKKNTKNLLQSGHGMRTESFGNWSPVGTSVAGIGGRILCIAIDPDDPNNDLFIGSASGGIWKTTNAGTNWTSVPVVENGTGLTLPVLGVSSIVIRPGSAGQEIIAGTGEVYRVDTSNIGYNVWKARGTYGIGIIRSSDGGATWTRVYNKDLSQMFGIQMLKFDPNNSSIVYACATDGLYKSTDAGITWAQVRAKTYVSDIAINPSNSNQIAIAFGNMKNPSKGVEYTTNGGTNWFAASGIAAFNGYIRLESSATGSYLYASVGHGSGNELYLSTNFGQTWSAKAGSGHCGGQYWFGHDLAVNPTNANLVMMGGVSYYRYTSTDGTTGGSRLSASGGHGDVHDIEYHPTNANIIYIANDGGMYKITTGAGGSATAINNGINAVQFYASFATSPTSANTMIGGLQDNGVVKWNGTSWSSILGGDGGPSMFHPKNGNKVLYSNDARAVFYSPDAGSTESQLMLNLGYGYATPYDDRTAFMSPIAMSYPDVAPNQNIVYYAASDNLHISLDSGGSFSRASPGTMTRYIDQIYKPAIALAVSRQNKNKVYVSTSPLSQKADDGLNVNMPARVLVSTNASDNVNYSFTNISSTLPDRFTTDFAISRFSDDSVYITMGGFGAGHVWLTPDGGATWLNRSSGLPDVPFNAILIDPIRPNVIYAACDYGIYVSHNKGATWFDFNEGFPGTVLVMDLQVTADNKIVAATHGRGVYRADLFTPPTTLPVTFSSFTGINSGNFNKLKWTVSEEIDLSRYVVERSMDGSNFIPVGTIVATNSPGLATYQMDDPVNGSTGKFYYRLKAFNRDGSYIYSDILIIRTNAGSQVVILGNPVNNKLVVGYNTRQKGFMEVVIHDALGRPLRRSRTQVNEGAGTYTVNGLEKLDRGWYIVSILLNRERFSERILKL
jgi:photosystem II stability/assembly factor-like uncharacterized protein